MVRGGSIRGWGSRGRRARGGRSRRPMRASGASRRAERRRGNRKSGTPGWGRQRRDSGGGRGRCDVDEGWFVFGDLEGEAQLIRNLVGRGRSGGRRELCIVECVVAKARHDPTRGGQDSGSRHRECRPGALVIHSGIGMWCGSTEVRHDPTRGGQSIVLFAASSFLGKEFSRKGCGHVLKEYLCRVCCGLKRDNVGINFYRRNIFLV